MEDFFGEEYQKQSNNQNHYDNAPPPPMAKNNTNKYVRTALIIFLIIAVFILGLLLGQNIGTTGDLAILNDVINEFKNNSIYYDKDTWEETLSNMIVNAGTYMLQTEDSYGYLLGPAELYSILYPSDATTSPTFGISFINTQGMGYYVNNISYGSGAYKSGLSVGDIVILINRDGFDSVDVRSASSEEINAILGGDYGTTVTFTVVRGFDSINEQGGNSTIEIKDIILSKIKYENNFVDYYFGKDNTDITDSALLSKLSLNLLDGTDIGYIKLNSFESVYDGQQLVDSASMQFANAMKEFKEVYGGNGKLVLDLMGNPGGNVAEATEIASYLVYDFDSPNKRNYLATTLKGQNNKNSEDYYTSGNYFAEYFDEEDAKITSPIVVFTDNNSASASELLLGAILDYGTGVQVGETSYGKGIAQTVKALNYTGTFQVENSNGGYTTLEFYYGIYYTFAKYYSPVTETNIHGVGYTPKEENKVDVTQMTELLNRAKFLL